MKAEKVLVLGASANPERYSNQALHLLGEYGHQVFPVNPGLDTIEKQPCYRSLAKAKESAGEIDTLTVYVNSQLSTKLQDEILSLGARRVIFNPGAENQALSLRLRTAGIETLDACTLVLLRTNQF